MDIDVIAQAICSGMQTAEKAIVESTAETYPLEMRTLGHIDFTAPVSINTTPLQPCMHEDNQHKIVEVGLEDQIPSRYALANVYAYTAEVESYEFKGLSVSFSYKADIYMWRNPDSAESAERKIITVLDYVLQALRQMENEWDLSQMSVSFGLGESQTDTYRLATITIPTSIYRDAE